MKQYLLTLFCLCVSMIALAQQKTITGTVIDANNEPVIGASVLEKGTSNGTITNLDGEYSLSVSAGATLVFSYIGYKTQEVSIGNKTTIKITLVEDSEQLDEVVVVGYGVQKKSSMTASVASVSAKKRFNEYYTKIENGVEVKGFAIVSPQAGKYKSACRKGLDWTLPTKNPGNNMWIGNLRANGMNYTYIRYADVLLMYAEAVLSGGKQGKLTSLQAVNEVRARKSVNMPALPSVDMKDIEYERILELTGEGHRFYDLLRWGKVASRFHELELSDPNFKQYNTSEYLGFVEGKNEWMPIPVDEVEGNPYITGNNPGWN